MKNDQHDGGGSCCMCDLCQEFRKQYLGIDVDEIERIINEQKSKEVEKELEG